MPVFEITKADFSRFLQDIMKNYELIAPVKTDLVRFQPIKDISLIHLAENSFFPVKEFFFRKQETLFTFNGGKIEVKLDAPKKRAFFGLRRCDLNAIMHQDRAFLSNTPDPYYKAQRDGALLLGYHCNEAPSIYCFCGSMDLKDFFDIMFFDRGRCYLAETGSEKGEAVIAKSKKMFKPSNYSITESDKKIEGTDRLLNKDISELYDHPDWKKGVDMCISCGACTSLCPTCYCFEVHDQTELKDPKKSKRERTWSSCQVKEFTKVAGGHVFRDKREDRFKHRIYHQLEYFREQHGIDLCVGCGRCITACPTKIDFVKIINEMK
ncbi:MAG: hypothetical protein QS98_C0011G0086 [archaeon GW2011_AR3]|nr:MAG: hypothetical protein QS98_C0011G0086 [archaeon GW2011_AR3]MBS3109649.1 4Fe-4S dicluster domain-containing protein [Candidatus Woesearchaeota archaeon]